jgi:hypothetical protein
MINIIFKNNTMIIILAIELLNTILLLAFLMLKSLLKNNWCTLKILAPFPVCRELKILKNSAVNMYYIKPQDYNNSLN